MTRLEKLKKELSRCELEIEKINAKKNELENKIMLEEQKEILKLLKGNNLSLNDVKQLINQK